MSSTRIFVGMDVHKATVVIAIAEPSRDSEVRVLGTFPNDLAKVLAQLTKLKIRYGDLICCYEAGPCGYTLYRYLTEAGIQCQVVAPNKIPGLRGRVKNDYRD